MSTLIAVFSLDPEVILIILSIVLFLSPGLILSGEYPTKNSSLNLSLLNLSITGTHTSSVVPG